MNNFNRCGHCNKVVSLKKDFLISMHNNIYHPKCYLEERYHRKCKLKDVQVLREMRRQKYIHLLFDKSILNNEINDNYVSKSREILNKTYNYNNVYVEYGRYILDRI